MNQSSKNLIGYCGLHCGACGIYQGRIKQAVENLRGLIQAYGFDKISADLAKWEPSFGHYTEFNDVMTGLVKVFGQCPGCADGGGDPNCAIRECCKSKAYATCVDCQEIEKCDILKQREWALKRLHEIKSLGFQRWAQEMQSKVNSGYCSLDEKR